MAAKLTIGFLGGEKMAAGTLPRHREGRVGQARHQSAPAILRQMQRAGLFLTKPVAETSTVNLEDRRFAQVRVLA